MPVLYHNFRAIKNLDFSPVSIDGRRVHRISPRCNYCNSVMCKPLATTAENGNLARHWFYKGDMASGGKWICYNHIKKV